MVENFVDSDATASSSGGESCDEMQPFNNQHQMHVSM
jgi:KAT8 regulatory NSL complex subunit 1